jgi:4-amino-4-deoxy-L-arabinose transferase-like glycosyltransferase
MDRSKFGEIGYIKLLLILLLAAILRYSLIALAYLHGYNPASKSDPLQYHILASNILEKHRYSLEGWVAVHKWENQSFWERNRTPGFPLFIAAVYKIAGPKPYAASLVLILVSCCTVLLVYAVGKQAFGHRIGLLAGTLFALSPTSVFYAGSMFPDTLHAAAVTAGYWALLKASNNRRYGLYALGGALLGLAGLIRPSTLYLALCTSLLIAWLHREWKAALLVAVLAWAVALPWAVRNLLVHGHFEVSSIGSYNMLYYNLAYARSRATGVHPDQIRELYATQELSGVSRKALIEQEARKYWKQLFKNQIIGSVIFWFLPPSYEAWARIFFGRAVATHARERLWQLGFFAVVRIHLRAPGGGFTFAQFVFYAIITLLVLWGVFASIKTKTQVHATILGCLFFLFFSLLTGAVIESRYRLQVEPILTVFAAKGLERVLPLGVQKEERTMASKLFSLTDRKKFLQNK